MSSEPVQLVPRDASWDVERQKEIVEMLEAWLDRAKNGELAIVAVAAALPDGSISSSYSKGDHYWHLLGAVADLQHRLVAHE